MPTLTETGAAGSHIAAIHEAQNPEAAPEKTLADRALALIRADILAGLLVPEARLRLGDLRRRYGLGLSPLREALMRLATEGHVTAEGQKGFSVAPISMDDLVDLTRTRREIESLALASAIEHGGPEWEARILAAFHVLSRTPVPHDAAQPDAANVWEARHRAFHQSLIVACSSRWILRIQAQLMDHSERYRRVRLFHSTPPRQLERDVEHEHRAIMEASIARDAARATKLLGEHIGRTAEAVSNYLKAPGKQLARMSLRPARRSGS